MVTREELEVARRDGRKQISVPCYRIVTRRPVPERVTRGFFTTLLELECQEGEGVPVAVPLLELALRSALPVVSDADLPSEREYLAWQVIALNREGVLIMMLALSTGLDIQFMFHGEPIWVRPAPSVWPAGTEAWALAVAYR